MTLRTSAHLFVIPALLVAPPAFAQTTPTSEAAAPPPPAPAAPQATTPPAAQPAPAPQPGVAPTFEITSLRVMRDKGLITAAEYDSAMADIAPSTGDRAAEATSLVVGRWSATLYGFAETDVINDSTQSFNDIAGNGQVLRPNGAPPVPVADQNTYGGNHGRTQMSIRNSRLGLRFRAPDFHGVRVNGTLETDFEGYLPTPSAASGPTESQFFSSPSLRIRHAYVRVETPYVDLLVGQYWDLFGWQNIYHPNSAQVQGLPGELYSRDAQIRVSHAWKTGVVDVEAALAARRPPSRDSQIPEGQGGLRIALPFWKGLTTNGATSTSLMPLSVAVTGDVRQFSVPEFSATPTNTVSLTTEAVAVDAFLPIIPARHEHEGNSLSINGEFVTGSGMSDLYTGLTGGLTFPTYINPNLQVNPAPPYPQDVDNGMVTYALDGSLHAIQWTTFLVGLQYYLPALDGKVWVSGNFARTQSNNIDQYTHDANQAVDTSKSYYPSNASVRKSENFFDANVFWQVVPGFRVAFEYANYNDAYADGVHAINNRFVGSGYFIF